MSGISEERLQDVERALMGHSMEAVGIVLKNAPDMLAEICRLRAENKDLKNKVALLTSDKRDLIEEIDGPVSESW